MVTLQHAGMLFHLAHPWLIADVVGAGVAHRDECRDRESRLAAIDPRAVPADVARLFESLHPFHHGGSRQADFLRERLITPPPITREEPESLPVVGRPLGVY